MRKSFSLIELFIVFAALMLLLNLLLPALNKTMGAAQSIHCTNNLRQIYNGLSWYTEDAPLKALPAHWIYLGSYNYWMWDKAIKNYMDGAVQDYQKFLGTVYECPSLSDASETSGSYGVNRYVFPSLWTNSSQDLAKRNRLEDLFRPSELTLVSDTSRRSDGKIESSFGICGANPNVPGELVPPENNDDEPGGLPAMRFGHLGHTSTTLFADGHVEPLELGLVQVKNIVPRD